MFSYCISMMRLSFFLNLCLFLAAVTSTVHLRDMSIDEYINFVNPPPVHKYQNKFGDSVLCVRFSDQISVKYAHDNITRGLKKPPKLKSAIVNISSIDSGGVNISRLGVHTECPEDTVATREIKPEDVERPGSVNQFLNRRGTQGFRQYAIIRLKSDNVPIYGVSVRFNLWSPYIANTAVFSLSQIWIKSDAIGMEYIEVGWMVYPTRYGDYQPRLFVFWTPDDYVTGCYNDECPGFVPIPGGPCYPGLPVAPVSVLGGAQYDFLISVLQEQREYVGLAWVLYYENVAIGYWPASLFNKLAVHAGHVDVGGEVAYLSEHSGRRLTKTHMGSGQFPKRGYHYVAYIRDMHFYGTGGMDSHPNPYPLVNRAACYDVEYGESNEIEWGKYIFFGGPGGFNPACVA